MNVFMYFMCEISGNLNVGMWFSKPGKVMQINIILKFFVNFLSENKKVLNEIKLNIIYLNVIFKHFKKCWIYNYKILQIYKYQNVYYYDIFMYFMFFKSLKIMEF